MYAKNAKDTELRLDQINHLQKPHQQQSNVEIVIQLILKMLIQTREGGDEILQRVKSL